MSQSDLDIANISRSLFRSEVNTALQALASQSSGATEPSITYAFQLWADTTTGKLKQRDAANSAWIEKGELASVDWGFLKKSNPAITGLLNLDDGADIASASTVDLTAATGNTVRITGTTAITAFTMNAGQQMELIAVGALPLTYNATTMNINGGVSYTCAAGDRLKVFKDGSGVVRVNVTKQDGTPVTACVDLTTNQTIGGVKTFSSTPILPMQSMVRVNTANGYGSTNTVIRRFTNVVTNQGTDITYADSATLGASFTINKSGVYAISYSDCFNTNAFAGVSLNSTQLSTSIASISLPDIVAIASTSAANVVSFCSSVLYLASGSVIRPHTLGATTGANTTTPHFTITRVS